MKNLRQSKAEDVLTYPKPFVEIYPEGDIAVEGGYIKLLINRDGVQLPEYVMLKTMKGNPNMLVAEGDKRKTLGPVSEHIGRFLSPEDELDYDFGMYERIMEDDDDQENIVESFVKYKSVPNYDLITKRILAIVDKHQDYLCQKENLDQLAYIMFRWENLYYSARMCYGYGDEGSILALGYCTNNPKYEIEDLGNTDEKKDIIYDAWAVNLDSEHSVPEEMKLYKWRHYRFTEADLAKIKAPNLDDDYTKLLHKKNKTMDDWYALLGDKRYPYHSIYRTRHAIDDHLLCVIGNGYGWNSDGFLCNDGPSGMDNDDYGFFMGAKDKLRQDIREELFAIIDTPAVQDCQNKASELQRKHWEKFISEEFNRKVERRALFLALDIERGKNIDNKYNDPAIDLIKEIYKDYSPNGKTILEVMNSGSEKDVDTMFNEIEAISKERLQTLTIEQKVASLIAEDKRLNDFMESRDEERHPGDYYPISNYSRMYVMPKNAHPSYIEAVRRICNEILQHADSLVTACEEPETKVVQADMRKQHAKENKKWAKKILNKITNEKHEKVD